MHQPRPHGLAAVGGEPTDKDSAAIELLARRLTNLKTLSGVDSMRMVRALPDGGYVIAQDMGGVFKAIAHKPKPSQEAEAPLLINPLRYIPMLYSGVVTRAAIRDDQHVMIKLTEQARRRLNGYSTKTPLPPKEVELERFDVEYNMLHSELAPDIQGVIQYTQYAALRPTWFSGAMAEVVQIVAGYGRLDLEPSDDEERDRLNLARIAIPEQVLNEIAEELGPIILPGYTGLPPKNGQIQYDYKFHNTHGVAFDNKNKPWLINIKQGGVYAMPLPLVPATTTRRFRKWVEEAAQDDELPAILDRFGGMPSGESFPRPGKDFEAWRRAGVIIKVCDVGDFYTRIMYSSACGWAFNTKGNEGFNTCYDYYDSEGLGYGLAYALRLNMSESTAPSGIPEAWHQLNPDQQAALNNYLSAVYRAASGDGHEARAVRFKLRLADVGELLSRAGQNVSGASERDYWHAKEMPPIAAHSGNVAEVGRGYLYHPAKFEFQPQIKFPEPFWGGCVSHDFLPLENGRYKSSYPNCDTIMFGYYAGDQLKVVKYFRDERTRTRPPDHNYEDCMIVGDWEKTEYLSAAQISGNFYTTDLDAREEVAERTRFTTIVGTDRGFDSKPHFAFDEFFAMPGTMWRNRYFSHKTTTLTTGGRSLTIGTCIPYFDRSSLLHARKDVMSDSVTTVAESLHHVTDPNTYRFYTYDFVMHWTKGPDRNGNAGSSAGETPYPKDGVPVWVVAYNYNPGGCSDFADQGDWVGGLPQDYTWLIHPQANVWQISGGGGAPPFEGYSRTEPSTTKTTKRLDYCFGDQPQYLPGISPDEWYFYGSPDDFGGAFYRDCSRVVFGDTEYANVSERVDSMPRKHWGRCSLVDSMSAHNFIGVINE